MTMMKALGFILGPCVILAACNPGSGDGGASQRAEDAAPPVAPQPNATSDRQAGYETPTSTPVTPAQSPQPVPSGPSSKPQN